MSSDQAVLAMSEPTYRALCYGGAGYLSNVGVYLLGTVFTVVKAVLAMCTVLQGCRLFKQCQNLPAGYCVTVVKAV